VPKARTLFGAEHRSRQNPQPLTGCYTRATCVGGPPPRGSGAQGGARGVPLGGIEGGTSTCGWGFKRGGGRRRLCGADALPLPPFPRREGAGGWVAVQLGAAQPRISWLRRERSRAATEPSGPGPEAPGGGASWRAGNYHHGAMGQTDAEAPFNGGSFSRRGTFPSTPRAARRPSGAPPGTEKTSPARTGVVRFPAIGYRRAIRAGPRAG
jgi:hypothetical protein